MECVADVQEAPSRVGEALAGRVREPGGGYGAQGGGVAQPAARLLQVRFEEVLELALALGPFGAQFLEFGETFRRLVAPVGEDGRTQSGGEAEVSGDVPGVQQTELDLEVLARGLAGLGRRTDGVVEGEAEVPDGVPDAVGQGGDGAGVAAVVQEEQVEVAAWGEFAASVAADGDEETPRSASEPASKRPVSQSSVSSARAVRRGGPDCASLWRRRSRAAA